MRLHVLDLALLAGAIGTALIAGAFFAFSSFVMGALGKLPPAHGIAAMQSINVVVINPWFMSAFIGTARAEPRHVGDGARAVAGTGRGVSSRRLAVVFRRRVPGHDAVQRAEKQRAGRSGAHSTTDAARLWADYLVTWTAWILQTNRGGARGDGGVRAGISASRSK